MIIFNKKKPLQLLTSEKNDEEEGDENADPDFNQLDFGE